MGLKSAICLASMFVFTVTQVQPPKPCTAVVRSDGSLPPLPQLYSCVRALDGKPYDAGAAKSCLDSILASGYIENGRIELSDKKISLYVTFVLVAPALTVESVDFVVDSSVKERMVQWIRSTGQTINAGDPYQQHRDERTAELIVIFFGDMGRKAAVSRKVELDYRTRRANLTYRITLGPDMVPMRALPPLNPECNVRISSFNLTDVDDHVPVNLVETMTKTHAFGCFSADAISEDTIALQGSGLFDQARYDVSGGAHDKQVYLHIRGKLLKVKEVRIVGYGSLNGRTFADDAALPLHAGDDYARSTANATLEYLKNKYFMADHIVETFEEDQLTREGQLIVVAQVFGYEEDIVGINGKEFHIAPSSAREVSIASK